MMSLKELESTIAQLPRNEQAELLRFLSRELRQPVATATEPQVPVDRNKWVEKLQRLQSLTAGKGLRPTQEILDELREDRI